jgi:hypothetical protein|tara:strand:- start:795 stop:1397 length:603 start_codon:yes stop_codon:yes gene_type:complete
MGNFDMNAFLDQLNAVKESMKEATTPEESALIGQAAATAEAPGGPAIAANEVTAEQAGQMAGQAALQEQAAAIQDENADVDAQMGDTQSDARVQLERKLERLAGQQLSAQAEAETAVDTAAVAPTNAVNMAKGAEESDASDEDSLMTLLAGIHDTLSKEASSEEEADEAIKVASEAVQYGRIMALGFVNGLQDLMTEGEE